MQSVMTLDRAIQPRPAMSSEDIPKPPDGVWAYGCRRMSRDECRTLVDAFNEWVRELKLHERLMPNFAIREPEFPLGDCDVRRDDERREPFRSWTHRFSLADGGCAIMRVRGYERRETCLGESEPGDCALFSGARFYSMGPIENEIDIEDLVWAGWRNPCPIDHPDYIAPVVAKPTREERQRPERKFRLLAYGRATPDTIQDWKNK